MELYADLLIAELEYKKIKADLLLPPVILGNFAFKNNFLIKWLGYIDRFILFLPFLNFISRKYDVIHICDHANSIYLLFLNTEKCLITCHDLHSVKSSFGFYKQHRIKFFGKIYNSLLIYSLKLSKCIVSVSNATLEDLVKIIKIPKSNIVVIHNSLNFNFKKTDTKVSENFNLNELIQHNIKYFLHVGGSAWYKNRQFVLDLFLKLREITEFQDYKLIFAGGKITEFSMRDLSNHIESDQVICMQNPSSEILNILYSRAEALIFPSISEGFGWPVIEAQACGCLVIASDIPSIREISGGAIIFIDPNSIEKSFLNILNDYNRKNILIDMGYKNIAKFDKELMINKYIDLYYKIHNKYF
ncbi:glycosyltransferase family 4 protein [Polynucleobacter sp. HIN11]|nr:glycosyltransferase family 1 protein [Polynucleobacter sp. HIN11]